MRMRALKIAGLLLLAGLWPVLASAQAKRAEVRRLEVVGAAPLGPSAPQGTNPREVALAEALWEGVSRVAESLLFDSELPEGATDSAPLRDALGRDTAALTRSFRILEDQGERPAVFSEDPAVTTEYVVVVEVKVDVERVKERLVAAGLLSRSEAAGELRAVRIEVQGLEVYPGYSQFLALVQGADPSIRSVTPLSFERGRSVLQVRSERNAAELLDRLLAQAPATLRLTPLGLEGAGESAGPERLLLQVDWKPPAAEGASEAVPGAGPETAPEPGGGSPVSSPGPGRP